MKKNRIIKLSSIKECDDLPLRLAYEANLIYCKFEDGSAWVRKNRWGYTGFVSIEEINHFIQLAKDWDKNSTF